MGGHSVREVMRIVDRRRFLPRRQRAFAGEDRPLAIGGGQTNSQPRTVQNMLDLLDILPGQRVLDFAKLVSGDFPNRGHCASLVERGWLQKATDVVRPKWRRRTCGHLVLLATTGPPTTYPCSALESTAEPFLQR